MSNLNINVGYSPKDFFYTNAIKSGDMPNNCDEILNRPYNKANCVGEKFNDNERECLDREICRNKEFADVILDIQQTHSGSIGKFDDTQMIFNRELFKMANLSIGIIGLMVLIHRFRKV